MRLATPSRSEILLCTHLSPHNWITSRNISATGKSMLPMTIWNVHRAAEKHVPSSALRLQKRTVWCGKQREAVYGINQLQFSKTAKLKRKKRATTTKTTLTATCVYSGPYALASTRSFSEQEVFLSPAASNYKQSLKEASCCWFGEVGKQVILKTEDY